VLEVTSARPSEGKSTTAANLALVCARAGQRVIVVDCDLRQPRIHSFFGLEPSRGFTSVLIGEATAEQVVFQISDEPGLSVVPAGSVPPDPSALLSGQRVRQLISEFRSMADLVIVDTPPVMAVPDAEVLSGLVDGVILVASAGTTRRSTFRRACDQLRVAGAPMAGTVLNRIDLSAPGGRSGHRYGTHDADDARAVRGNGATTTS
jgi:capsular exopolysaccharide synthesis family protein